MRYSLDVPLKLNGHSSRCKWCANLLAPARRIWKVRDAHRYYCSEFCFLQGAERQLRDDAQLAGTVHLHWTATLAVILSVLMVAFIFIGETRARAQGVDGTDHQKHAGHTQYRSSCCNGDDPERATKSDCHSARAYPDENGQRRISFAASMSRFRKTRSSIAVAQTSVDRRERKHQFVGRGCNVEV